MEYLISRRYHFESAHHLPKVRDGHRCKRMHGHNYKMDVAVCGELDPAGFVMDFWDLDDIVKPLLEKVDHRCLNDIEGLENPTAEHIAEWFYRQLYNSLQEENLRLASVGRPRLRLWTVTVFETDECAATFPSPYIQTM